MKKQSASANAPADVRDIGITRAVIGSTVLRASSAWSAPWARRWSMGWAATSSFSGVFTIGTIVAFGSYLGQLYGALQGLANAPVDFATSMVSFERVFEVLDLPHDIVEKPDALPLPAVKGELVFDDVTFSYKVDENKLLKDVKRYGRMEDVRRGVFSGREAARTRRRQRRPS